MAGSGFLLNADDAQKAVNGYKECAGNATSTLKTMSSQVDELMTKYAGAQATALREVADDLKLRINKLVAKVDDLSQTVQSTATTYGSSDADIAQTFKTAVNSGGAESAVYGRLTS
jgi:uncharacterized protein YukE